MKIIGVDPAPLPGWFLLAEKGPEAWHSHLWLLDREYLDLVEWIASQVLTDAPGYLYQAEPNLRVHPPGGKAVDWHTDADFGHLAEEYNVWVPLTETNDHSQRLWVLADLGGEIPAIVRLGEAFIFHGARRRHGNQVNTTDTARISFDFRLLAKEHYVDTGAKTVKYKVPMRIGDYWEEMT